MATNARGEWHRHHIQSLYLGTITATAPSLLPLVFLPALSGFFIEHAQTLGNHPRRALLINQPAGSGPLFPFYAQRHPSSTEVRL